MRQRTLFVLLFASLALNLFILGAFVGVVGLGAHLRARHGEGPRLGGPMAIAARSLPPDQAIAFRNVLRDQVAAVQPQIRQAQHLRRQAFLRLSDDPVDAPAIFRDLQAARAQQIQAQDTVDHGIVAFAAHLPREQRARFGEALARPPRPPHGPRPGGPAGE